MSLSDVRFAYPAAAPFLGPVSLEIGLGQLWMIVGPNGAGKSTLLKIMAGLLRPTAGDATLDGRRLDGVAPRDRARRIAYLPQHLPTHLTQSVHEVVLLGRYPHRTLGLFESAHDHAVVEQSLEVMGLSAFADRPVATLSGGEAQRVHVAAALAQEPALLLLDEPTTSLDLRHQLEIYRLLQRLVTEQGLGVVVVTHDLNGAARYGSHVALMNAGRFVAVGPAADVLQPAHLDAVYGVRTGVVTAGSPPRRWVVPIGSADDR